MNNEVKDFINEADERHKEILFALRSLILKLVPNAIEQFKWSRPVYSLEKDFCYLKTTKKSVTLGFFDFNKIKTNDHLIEGTGASMRHVKISQVEQINEYGIEKMIQEVLS